MTKIGDVVISVMLVPSTNKRHSETIPASAIWACVILTDGTRELDTEAEYTEIERKEWDREIERKRERKKERARERQRVNERESEREKEREREREREIERA